MARPLTLFTGQWTDLPIAELAPLAKSMGYDGLELACGGDHFNVQRALAEPGYAAAQRALLAQHGLEVYAIGNHLVGQAVCDLIDARHRTILPAHVWGDGEPEGVRQRAARELADTARAAALLGVQRVTGFTGSSIWHAAYAFPPTPQSFWDEGYADFGRRFKPILDEFERQGVNFALEVHPTEIAFDIASSERALEAVNQHPRFGFNFDPSHFAYQGVDYVRFIRQFGPRIFHVHMKDVWWGRGDGTVGTFGGHTSFGDPRRGWDFRSVGRGMIDFESIMVALGDVGYQGPLSVEWEDSRMDRVHGATESAAYCRKLDFPPAHGAFDANFGKGAKA
ncbi:MAG: sugar phosphate isomerase/epimerase [Paucibacter sp.]|nr:sugar phosphate isomerase/epimerase [Roseateles sp.]